MPRFTKKHIDRCVESATYQKAGSLKLDREAGIVYGVKVLGWNGKGGQRIYQRRAVESALPLYDGAVVNLNHVANDGPADMRVPNRDITQRFGRLKDPFIREDGLCGNIKYNTKHAWAPAFEWFVEHDPEAIGLSHDAILQGPMQSDGKRSIESIPKVFSVDLVADPGSTKGLRENMAPDDTDDDSASASMDMDDLDNNYDDAEEHLCAFIVSILKDKSLAMKERRQKVMDAMDMMDDDDGEESEEGESTEPDEKETMSDTKETPAKESMALTDAERVELDDFRREKARRVTESKAREKCKIADLDESLVTEVFVGQLIRAQESEWEAIIADRKVKVDTKPVSTPPSPGGKKPVALEDFEKHLLGGK